MNESIAHNAMTFAFDKHKNQKRKYTNNAYTDHLAEVVAISMSVGWHDVQIHPDKFMAIGWLHDVVEDQSVSLWDISRLFGEDVAMGVLLLTDKEEGNRKARKEAQRNRLSRAPSYVQTIKVADMISNGRSIIEHDKKFASVYVEECKALASVLKFASPILLETLQREVLSRQLLLF